MTSSSNFLRSAESLSYQLNHSNFSSNLDELQNFVKDYNTFRSQILTHFKANEFILNLLGDMPILSFNVSDAEKVERYKLSREYYLIQSLFAFFQKNHPINKYDKCLSELSFVKTKLGSIISILKSDLN